MAAKIQVYEHDFKLRACLDYAHNSWNLHRSPKTAEIKPVADFFKGRCSRLRALMQLPAQVGNVTIKLRDTYMRSIFDVTGGLDAGKLTTEQIKKIDLRSNEILTELAEEKLRLEGTPEWDQHVHRSLTTAFGFILGSSHLASSVHEGAGFLFRCARLRQQDDT